MVFTFRSEYGSTLPVVRIVVTPFARYKRGAEKVICGTINGDSLRPEASRLGRAM